MNSTSRKSAAEIWDVFFQYTARLSDILRHLGFSGAALCWVLKGDHFLFTHWVLAALLCLIVFFVFDIAQYLSNSLLLVLWIRDVELKAEKADLQEMLRQKQQGQTDAQQPMEADTASFPWPPALWVAVPGYLFLGLKIVTLIVAFVLIGVDIIQRVHAAPFSNSIP